MYKLQLFSAKIVFRIDFYFFTPASWQEVKSLTGLAKLTVMQSNNLNAVNFFDQQTIEGIFIHLKNKTFMLTALPYSFSVLRIKFVPEQMPMKKASIR